MNEDWIKRQNENNSIDGGSDDKQGTWLNLIKMMEIKLRNIERNLRFEKAKRKQSEELAQSLLQQNGIFKEIKAKSESFNNSNIWNEINEIQKNMQMLKMKIQTI